MSKEILSRTDEKTTATNQLAKRGIGESQWVTLTKSLYPGANPNSVLLVWDYCAARGLDPMKKPCHIVPMEVKDARTGEYTWRDVILPGIYEYRTTAHRTGLYLGHSKPEFGPLVDAFGVLAPKWCEMVVYRATGLGGTVNRAEFPVRVLFAEVVALTKDKKGGDLKANSRWSRAPEQMLTKCCEAAGLREAFPEHIGGTQTEEELSGQRHIEQVIDVEPEREAPAKFDEWLTDLTAVADEGEAAFEKAWAASSEAFRTFLTDTKPQTYEFLKAKALAVLAPTSEP